LSELLTKTLHEIGQVLLIPCMVILLILMVLTVWQLGDLMIEALMERKSHRTDGAVLLLQLKGRDRGQIKSLLESWALPRSQKAALLLLVEQEGGEEELTILAQRLLAEEEAKCASSLRPTELVVKLGPMFGLLGTLIPLGPGIVALGMGDTETLSKSMAVAFDTTIAGLVSAAVCFVISGIRKRWYSSQMATLEALMEKVIREVAEDAEG
jgi:Biopolymer transport proteins